MNTLDKYIVVIKNIVPLELCDQILNEYIDSNLWVIAGAGKYGDPMTQERSCDTILMSEPYNLNSDIRVNIDQNLFQCASAAIKEYNILFDTYIQEDTGYELLQYKVGDFYKEHTDSFLQSPRLVSCSFALNDNYEGGEFAFFNKERKYRINQGDAIMFPSTFMYPHQILPVTKGTRYSIITWFR